MFHVVRAALLLVTVLLLPGVASAQAYNPFAASPNYVPPAFQPGRRGSGPSIPVEIRLRVFIPAPAVSLVNILGLNDINNGLCTSTRLLNLDTCLFRGDGRGFSYAEGTQRFLSNVTLLPGGGAREVTYYCRTHEYQPDAGQHPDGKPWWWWELKPNAPEIANAKLEVRGSNADVLVTNLINLSVIDIKLRGANPLVFGPPIDAALRVWLRYEPGRPMRAAVTGTHDGFPAYELYVNGTMMRGAGLPYDPATVFLASPYSLANSLPMVPQVYVGVSDTVIPDAAPGNLPPIPSTCR